MNITSPKTRNLKILPPPTTTSQKGGLRLEDDLLLLGLIGNGAKTNPEKIDLLINK